MRFRGFLIRRYETFSPLDKADSCECYFTEIIFTESKFSKEVIPLFVARSEELTQLAAAMKQSNIEQAWCRCAQVKVAAVLIYVVSSTAFSLKTGVNKELWQKSILLQLLVFACMHYRVIVSICLGMGILCSNC